MTLPFLKRSLILIAMGIMQLFSLNRSLASQDKCDFVLGPESKVKSKGHSLKSNTWAFSGPSDFIRRYPQLIQQLSVHPEIKDQYPDIIRAAPQELFIKLQAAEDEQAILKNALKAIGLPVNGGDIDSKPLNRSPEDALAPMKEALPPATFVEAAKDSITICLRPGVYSGPFILQNKSRLRIIGIRAKKGLSKVVGKKKKNRKNNDYRMATVSIHASSNISIENLTITNPNTTYSKENHPISRALQIQGSANVFVQNSRIGSAGKGTIWARASSGIQINQSSIKCYYFCVVAGTAELKVNNSGFLAHHQKISTDAHSILWTNHSTQHYSNCTFNLETGRSIITGINTPSAFSFGTPPERIIFTGKTRVSGNDISWLQQNQNYDGIEIDLYDDYPEHLKLYHQNDFKGGEPIRQPYGQVVRFHKTGTPDHTDPNGGEIKTRTVPPALD